MSSILDLSPVTLLLQEVQTVTSAMRRNQRWASVPASTYASTGLPASISSRGRRDSSLSPTSTTGKRRTDDEGDLMLGFIELRRTLTGVSGKSIWFAVVQVPGFELSRSELHDRLGGISATVD